ncbi:MAG: TIGR00725 family protein [Candidatus Helarchaeales archaeon]
MKLRQVSVIGSAILRDESIYEFTKMLGRALAERNLVITCGGRGGVMEAICKGAEEVNGISVAIIPTDNKQDANKHASIVIPTGLGELRNFVVINSGDAVICIAGEFGTRIEAEYALKINKPLITVPKTGGVSREFSERFKDQVFSANSIEEIIKILENLLPP